MILSVKDLTFGYLDETIFKGISFNIDEGDRIGLVGGNGVGKTTLINCILGNLLKDSGSITFKSNLSVGYLKQGAGLDSDNTIYAEMRTVFKEVIEKIDNLLVIAKSMQNLSADSYDYKLLSAKYQSNVDFINAKDGYNVDVFIKSVLNGMGFLNRYDESIGTLSGGEKTRLQIAKLLLSQPELLVLDEPTNHLDTKTLLWLESFLQGYKGSILVVSHDRYFLDKVANRIIELENLSLIAYRGNYSKYKQIKTEKYEYDLREFERQQEKIAAMEDFIARNIVCATSTKQAKSRRKQLANLDVLEKPVRPPKPPKIAFSYDLEPNKMILTVSDYDLSVGGKLLAENINLEIKRGEKVALVGGNGTGKTTLLRQIMEAYKTKDQIFDQTEKIRFYKDVFLGYYDQENQNLNFDETVLMEMWNKFPTSNITTIRSVLGGMLFENDDMDKKIGVLSGGERAKLGFCVMSMQPKNTLVLDEPTNHLDLISREALENGLNAFKGTLLFVSHDRYFLNAIATKVAEIEDGKFTVYNGNFDEYIAAKLSEVQAVAAENTAKNSFKADKNVSSKQARSNKVKMKQEIAYCEETIKSLENEQELLHLEIATKTVASNYQLLEQKCKLLEETKSKIDGLYRRWEELLDGSDNN